jgi:hypothetical protein
MAQMASGGGKELMCFLYITINVGPSLMKEIGEAFKIYCTRPFSEA